MNKKPFFAFAFVGLAFLLASCAITTSSSSASLSSEAPLSSEVSSISTSVASSGVSSTTSTTTSVASSSSLLRVFTTTELAQYNGDNGSTAYIAVNWVVYDVTNCSEFSNGWHKGMHLAGTNCTTEFADSPHSAAFLATLPIVGSLAH